MLGGRRGVIVFWGGEIGRTACLEEILVQVVGFRQVLVGKRKERELEGALP